MKYGKVTLWKRIMIKRRIQKFLMRLFAVSSDQLLKKNVREIQRELLAAHYITPFMPSYFPWTTGALRPSCLITIINDIIINRRSTIVECGAGISTLVLAKVACEYGAHLYSLEEDQKWAELVSQHLTKENLLDHVTMIYAPLQEQMTQATVGKWYDEKTVHDILGPTKVDLLIVDGPDVGLVRRAAIPFFLSYLSSEYTVVLDDIPRGGREFVNDWEQQLGIPFRILNDFALATTNPGIKTFLMP
jgi:hypothetical protein